MSLRCSMCPMDQSYATRWQLWLRPITIMWKVYITRTYIRLHHSKSALTIHCYLPITGRSLATWAESKKSEFKIPYAPRDKISSPASWSSSSRKKRYGDRISLSVSDWLKRLSRCLWLAVLNSGRWRRKSVLVAIQIAMQTTCRIDVMDLWIRLPNTGESRLPWSCLLSLSLSLSLSLTLSL